MFISRRTHVEQQLLSWRFTHHLPNHTKLSRITPSQHCKPAAGITEALVWTGCCWSCCGACWATPFKMHVDFCPLLRETFAKPTRRPQPSARCASDEKQAPGVLVLGSGKASLLEVWLLHLGFVPPDFRSGYQCQPEIKTIKSTHYSWNNVRHDHIHARNYSVLCIYLVYLWWFMISNFRETVANNKFSFANSVKIFAVSDVETLEAFAIENPYMDIEIANHVYIYY